jgi:putative transposase
MDNKHLLAAVRYIAANPVKAGLVKRPEQYRWSSVAAYLFGRNDPLVKVAGLNKLVDDWTEFFGKDMDSSFAERMRKHERTGRPLGSESFMLKMEKILDRLLRPKKAGRKPKRRQNDNKSAEK